MKIAARHIVPVASGKAAARGRMPKFEALRAAAARGCLNGPNSQAATSGHPPGCELRSCPAQLRSSPRLYASRMSTVLHMHPSTC